MWRWSLKYAWLTVKHKWFVFLACRKVGVSLWQAIAHDLSKFTPAELPAYGRQFFGDKGDPEGFACAWLHHQNVNPHHWEYWIPRTGHNRAKQVEEARVCAHQPEVGPYTVCVGEEDVCECGDWNAPLTHENCNRWLRNAENIAALLNQPTPLPMPEKYVREMVADWMGASKAYTGSWDMADWLVKNLPKMRLHASTLDVLYTILIWEVDHESGRAQADRVENTLRTMRFSAAK